MMHLETEKHVTQKSRGELFLPIRLSVCALVSAAPGTPQGLVVPLGE